jgi:hypothetical protein
MGNTTETTNILPDSQTVQEMVQQAQRKSGNPRGPIYPVGQTIRTHDRTSELTLALSHFYKAKPKQNRNARRALELEARRAAQACGCRIPMYAESTPK